MTQTQTTGTPEQPTSAHRAVLARIYSLAMDVTLQKKYEVSVSYHGQSHVLYVSVYRVAAGPDGEAAPERTSLLKSQHRAALPPHCPWNADISGMPPLTAMISELEQLLELPGAPS